jgi:ribosomal protein L30E
MKKVEEALKEAVKKDRIVIGTRSVIKGLKRGEFRLVVFASNTPEAFRQDLGHCAGVSGIDIQGLEGDSAHLGDLCGKPFHILAVGVRK